MTQKTFVAGLFAAALLCASTLLSAQALPKAPPPPPTDTEVMLSKMQDPAEVMARAEQWRQSKDYRRYTYALERLVQLRPYSPTFQYKLAEAYALQDRKTQAYDTLIRIQKSGLAMNPDQDKDFDLVRNTPAFKYIVEGIVTNSTAWGDGKVRFKLDKAPELVESIAYDSKRKRFLVGSVRTGEILAVDDKGKTTPFASPKSAGALKSVFALAADDARGFLWVGTAGAPQFVDYRPSDVGTAALVKLDLATGKFIEAYKLPFNGAPKGFGGISIAANGNVYATDAFGNVVYQVSGGQLRPLFNVPNATSLRGIAVSPDQKFLYFVDYELGLRVADLSKSEVRELAVEGHNLGGIDGLYYYENHLIAVQNGSVPTRILRIALDPAKGVLKAVQPLEANKEALVMPTYGAMAGNDFYFIANSQRDQYGPDGKPYPDVFVEPRQIYQVSARFAWNEDVRGQQMPMLPGK